MSHDVVRVGVAALVRNNEGKYLLGKRKGSHGAGEWSSPGGHLELWESFEECSERELLEETNLSFEEKPKQTITVNNPWKSIGRHYITIFMEGKVKDETALKNMEPHKCEMWEWISLQDLLDGKYQPLFQPIQQWLLHQSTSQK